jgi:hypothetical protein
MGTMEDFMRGGPVKPRFKLDIKALEARFGGAPLGPMLIALSEKACQLAPFEPWAAFEPLEMRLIYLGEEQEEEERPPLHVPDNIVIFLETGIDLHCAGFVDEEKRNLLPVDERPICFITEDEEPQIVAPNLAAFLGMVAVAGVEAVAIEQSDGDWLEMREERMHEQAFKVLSKELCSLQGVKLATKTQAPRQQPLKLGGVDLDPDIEPMGSGLERVRFLLSSGRKRQAADELAKQIGILVSLGDAVAPHQWQVLAELVKSMRPSLSSTVRAELERRGVV